MATSTASPPGSVIELCDVFMRLLLSVVATPPFARPGELALRNLS
jgi:hypothetical protein